DPRRASRRAGSLGTTDRPGQRRDHRHHQDGGRCLHRNRGPKPGSEWTFSWSWSRRGFPAPACAWLRVAAWPGVRRGHETDRRPLPQRSGRFLLRRRAWAGPAVATGTTARPPHLFGTFDIALGASEHARFRYGHFHHASPPRTAPVPGAAAVGAHEAREAREARTRAAGALVSATPAWLGARDALHDQRIRVEAWKTAGSPRGTGGPSAAHWPRPR